MNESDNPLTVNLQGFDPRQMFSEGFSLGSMDLIQGGSFKEVIGRTVSLLMDVRDSEGKNRFSGVSVILPPASVTSLTADKVYEALAAGAKVWSGVEASAEQFELIMATTRVVRSPTLEIADLEATVLNLGPRMLVGIADISLYRDESFATTSVFGVTAVLTFEDLWAPQVARFCRLCVSALKAINGYAVVHVNESPAIRSSNIDMLIGVDDCYVVELRSTPGANDKVEKNAQKWLSLMLSGAISEVVSDIESLQLPEINRLHVLAMLFSRSGNSDGALECLAQLVPQISSMSPTNLIQVSWLAHKAGDDSLALVFLPADPEDVCSVMWLEQALELATLLEKNKLIERYVDRLALLCPSSARLKENCDRRLLMNCRESTFGAEYVFTTTGFTENHLVLLDEVLSPQQDYKPIIEEAKKWGSEWFELAVICCAMHAWRLGQCRDATDAARRITTSALYGRQATQITLSSMNVLMLKDEIGPDEHDYYREPMKSVFRFLAQHPEDDSIRSKLLRLLSVDSCGDIGVPIAALTMLYFAGEGVQAEEANESRPDNHADSHELDEVTINALVEQGLKWLSAQGAAEHGVTVLPKELAKHPDHIIRFLTQIIAKSAPNGEDIDVDFLEKLVLLVCAIYPHATDERNADLRVLQLLASQCATVGQYQRARNLVEQMLLMGQGEARRARMAWIAFADIYHRCSNSLEALVGLACAMATDAPVEKVDLWQEIYTAIRVLRDLGLIDFAHQFLPSLRVLTADLGYDATNDARVVAIEMSLRLMKDKENSEEIGAIVDDLGRSCKGAMNNRSLLFPLVVLLSQAIQRADNVDVTVSDEARELLKIGLGQLGARASHLVQTFSTDTPSATDVAEMFNNVQRGLYARDAAGDFAFVGIAARRLLNTELGEDNTLAVELLADHAVALDGVPPVLESSWPIQYARSLNEVGLDIAFIGLDSAGELCVTYVSGGEVRRIEQPRHQCPFKLRLLAWLENYPRRYGYIDSAHGHNEFFTTMEELDVRLPSSHALMVIAEPLLQQITFNLLIVEPDGGAGFSQFLGSLTGVGMVPSLTWFSMVRSSKRSGSTLYKAWISAQNGPKPGGPLDLALDRLGGTFEEFEFVVDTGRKLPQGMSDAGLAVVTAHGGLTTDGRYIHSIRDEGNLVESPSALALALAGVEVVILFVCSGGRIDKHPLDNTTIGLPKQLLDKGCRAVIASPWPLDVKVTYRWLEPFMLEWEAGSTILHATKKANEAVKLALGDGPQYSQAMTVFGDVLLTKLEEGS